MDIYKSYSLDTVKLKDEILWYKIKFKALDLDLEAKRLVLIFKKSYFTDSTEVVNEKQFKDEEIFYTASHNLFVKDGAYIPYEEGCITEYEFLLSLLLSKESVYETIKSLNNNKIFL